MFYIIYGLDRCEPETEFSLVLVKHLVDPDLIWFYITRILINVAIIRIFTLVVMYFKFNNFGWLQKEKVKNGLKNEMKMIEINSDKKLTDFNNNNVLGKF